MVSFLIVGSGYRSEYYARIAAAHPDLFRAMYLCRSAEKAAALTARTGLPATACAAEAEAFGPDFAVVAVDRGHVAEVTEEWGLRGYPVLAETPVGDTPEKLLRIWEFSRARGIRISSAEQYHRHPVLAAGFAHVRDGRIGTPLSGYLSLVHDYHAMSLLRRMLLTENEPYVLRAGRQSADALATDSRYGAILDGSMAAEERDVAQIRFASGKTAVYDFSPVQYRSFIRSRHLTVRGTRGEWSDRVILYADEKNRPQRIFLMPELPEKYRALDSQALRDIRKSWSPELAPDTVQDEYAIATMLLDMGEKGADSDPYPLREALDDAYFWLLLREALAQPWSQVAAKPMPWNAY